MQLNQVSTYYFNKDDLVDTIEIGILYYVYTGRNAWHSTWITRYTAGCMHTSFKSARDFVENRRVQGSVFYIQQLPALIIKSSTKKLYITEINNKNPLSGYSAYATSNKAPVGTIFIENHKNNYLVKDELLENIILSFNVNSRFWKKNPSAKNSILIFGSINHELYEIEKIPNNLIIYKSMSYGKNTLLGWRAMNSSLESLAIKDLYEVYNYNNKVEQHV